MPDFLISNPVILKAAVQIFFKKPIFQKFPYFFAFEMHYMKFLFCNHLLIKINEHFLIYFQLTLVELLGGRSLVLGMDTKKVVGEGEIVT